MAHGSANTQISGQLAMQYLERYPRTGTLTLARKMYAEHSAVWSGVEAARCALRYYRGSKGKKNRQLMTRRHYVEQTAESREALLPKSDAKEWKPYTMPNGYGLVLADVHVPYHDEQTLEIAARHARAKGATDWLLLLGDFVDCYSLSRWIRDPQQRRFAEERDMGWQIIDYLRAETGASKAIWKLGNHEDRLERYLAQKAPELLGVEAFTFPALFEFDKRKIDHVASTQIIHCGHLTILHGHEYGRGTFSPVNPARGMFLRAKDCALSAHQHQTSHHTDPTIRDKQISCWSVGCACELHPKYRPLNRWNHGFALLKKQNRDFDVENKRVLPDGELV